MSSASWAMPQPFGCGRREKGSRAVILPSPAAVFLGLYSLITSTFINSTPAFQVGIFLFVSAKKYSITGPKFKIFSAALV